MSTAERSRLYRQRKREGRRVLSTHLAVNQDTLDLLVQHNVIPYAATESDEDLSQAIAAALDDLADQCECHSVTGTATPRRIINN